MQTIELAPDQLLGPLNEVESKNAPGRLFVAGDRSILARGPRVSVVGSRKASSSGLAAARQLAEALAARDVVIVSGLAEGVDTEAHEGAMMRGGRTIAVLGTPLDKPYPSKNRELFQRIVQHHLAVSQFAPGTRTQPSHFPMRNRTMALIADATIIVEAGEGSGSLHQGWEALRLGRPLFLSETLVEMPGLRWASEMTRYGAQPLALDSIEAVFESLPERRAGEPLRVAL